MRLGVRAENPLEWLLLRLGLMPLPLLEGYWGMAISRSIITATELGVFDALEAGPMTAAELAEKLGTDPSGTEVLLGALNGARYVTRKQGRYANAKTVRRWLLDGGLVRLKESVLFYGDLWSEMSDLSELVSSGSTRNLHYDERPAEFWERYLRGLAVFVPLVAPEIVRKCALPADTARILDAGGGHGMYSAAFARAFPDAAIEVLDLPGACAVGRDLVGSEGLGDRVVFREGDLRHTRWGEGFDAVLLFNVIHNLTEDESRSALSSAYAALRPGGTLVVLEGEYQGTDADVSLTAGLNEMLFFLTSGTRVYPEQTMRGWMREAGFGRARTRHLIRMPMMALITAERQ